MPANYCIRPACTWQLGSLHVIIVRQTARPLDRPPRHNESAAHRCAVSLRSLRSPHLLALCIALYVIPSLTVFIRGNCLLLLCMLYAMPELGITNDSESLAYYLCGISYDECSCSTVCQFLHLFQVISSYQSKTYSGCLSRLY